MSTVKISELALISQLDANTANSLFMGVDLPSGVTGKFTAHTLAQGLYSNEILNVGNNAIVYDNVIAQFSGNSGTFLQINNQNFDSDGSTDYVASTNDSDNTNNYIDMGINGSTFSDPVYSSMKPYDGYVYSHGPAHTEHRGNLVIGTASTEANIIFIAGGTTSSNIVGRISKNVFDFLKNVRVTGTIAPSGGIVFGDGSTQTTSSEGTVGYANAAFVQANAAFIKANTHAAAANSGALYANGAFLQANAAFNKANNAFANATGTFAGDLTILGNTSTQVVNTGNLTVVGIATVSGNTNLSGILNVVGAVNMNATLVLANSNFTATESAVTISASPSVATPSNDGYMLHISGKEGIPTRIVSDAYGTGAYSVYASRSARGNIANPTAVQSGDVMGRFSSNGYGTSKFQTLGTGRIDFVAAENYTDSTTGSQIKFWNCPIGSNTLTNILTLNGDAAVFTGYVEPQKGFVYTPRVPAGNQTAITINYAIDSMIKANLVADLTVSHSNFVMGKVVEMWLTNTGGLGRTVTHGISATNSTTNSTTFTIAGTSSAHLKFFSIDGDLANTFVSVVYS